MIVLLANRISADFYHAGQSQTVSNLNFCYNYNNTYINNTISNNNIHGPNNASNNDDNRCNKYYYYYYFFTIGSQNGPVCMVEGTN